MNVGPVRSKTPYVIDTFNRLAIDVLVVCETHLTDTSTFRADLHANGLQAIMLARPAPPMSYKSRVGGGIAVIWKKTSHLDISVLSSDQKGAISLMCRSRDGRYKCAIIACY